MSIEPRTAFVPGRTLLNQVGPDERADIFDYFESRMRFEEYLEPPSHHSNRAIRITIQSPEYGVPSFTFNHRLDESFRGTSDHLYRFLKEEAIFAFLGENPSWLENFRIYRPRGWRYSPAAPYLEVPMEPWGSAVAGHPTNISIGAVQADMRDSLSRLRNMYVEYQTPDRFTIPQSTWDSLRTTTSVDFKTAEPKTKDPKPEQVISYVQPETEASKQAWEESVESYARDVCQRAGIKWRPEWASEIAPLKSKLDVNKKIFTDLNLRAEKEEGIPDALVAALQKIGPRGGAAYQIQQYENSIQQYIDQAHGYFNEAEKYLRQIPPARSKIFALMALDEKDHYVNQYKELMKTGLYEFDKMESNILILRTTNPVVINWKDRNKGIDMTVKFGRFRVRVGLAEGTIHVEAFELPPEHRYDGYVHPHLNGSNNWKQVCWGTAKDAYVEFNSKGDLVKCLKALWLIMNTYNDGSPYVPLHKFWGLQNKDTLAQSPRVLTKHSKGWINEDDRPEGIPSLDNRSEDDDGNEVDQVYVQFWMYKFTNYGNWDEADGYYFANSSGEIIAKVPMEDGEVNISVDWT